MDIPRKLQILADAAKFDASCAATRRPRGGNAPATPEALAIADSFTADGRRVPLLRILLTNHCVFDCRFCVNRRSSDAPRARFSPDEVVRLTLDFHARGLIEGLFLSAAVDGSPDDTMEQLVTVARTLRREHHYFGYIHLKTIAGASPVLIEEAGRWADRLSVNVEVPRQADLDRLAPEKQLVQITRAMELIRDRAAEAAAERAVDPRAPRFAPAGQTTQMIVGVAGESDADILLTAAHLYARERLRRVYYSAFVPIPDAPRGLPETGPAALREQRLYQADWLIRAYGFTPGDLTPPDEPNLDLAIDPKLAWALRHRDRFPVDVNRASRRTLLRVPGFGATAADRILTARRTHRLHLADLAQMRVPLQRALPFIVAADHSPQVLRLDALDLRQRLAPPDSQLELFA